jgi:hypothetical protein
MDEEEINLNVSQENVNGLSIINDPFKSSSITNILISYNNSGYGTPYWYGRVTFKNGNTAGEQRTDNVESFEEIVVRVRQILNSVNNQ